MFVISSSSPQWQNIPMALEHGRGPLCDLKIKINKKYIEYVYIYIFIFKKTKLNKKKKQLKCKFTFYVLIELQIVQKEIFFSIHFYPLSPWRKSKNVFFNFFLVLSIFFLQFILCMLHVGLFDIRMKSLQLVYISR